MHNKIVNILFELCRETKTDAGKPVYSSIFAHHISREYKPIILSAHATQHKPFARNYYPDVWAKVKRTEKVDVYEVWHSETETEAIEDILFSSLVKGIRYFHIVCTGENLTKKDTKELVALILKRMRDEKGNQLLGLSNVYITELPERIWGDGTKTSEYLKKELRF